MASTMVLALAVLLLVVCPAAVGTKRTSFKDDRRSSILIDRFSFSSHGEVSISVTDAKAISKLADAEPDPSQLGIFLLSDKAPKDLNPFPESSPSCVLDSPYAFTLFTFVDLDDQGHFNRTFPLTQAGEFRPLFASCVPETKVTMELQTHMYNANQPRLAGRH